MIQLSKDTISYIPTILIFIVVLCCASAGVCQEENGVDNRDGGIVAKVNGQPIEESLLTAEYNKELRKYNKFNKQQSRPELLGILRRQALDRVIESMLLNEAVAGHVVADIDKKVGREVEALKAQYQTSNEFFNYLKLQRLNEDTLLSALRSKIQIEGYWESQGLLHYEPSEEMILAYYEKSKEMFKVGERVHVRHILVQADAKGEQAQKDAARMKAENILKNVRGDSDFAKLAAEQSDCLRSKQNGGDLGFIERGFMPEEFDKMAFALEKNKISEVVATQFGYHIVEVLDKKPAGYIPLDTVRDFIKKYLEEKHLNKARAHHVTELREQANVEIFLQ